MCREMGDFPPASNPHAHATVPMPGGTGKTVKMGERDATEKHNLFNTVIFGTNKLLGEEGQMPQREKRGACCEMVCHGRGNGNQRETIQEQWGTCLNWGRCEWCRLACMERIFMEVRK